MSGRICSAIKRKADHVGGGDTLRVYGVCRKPKMFILILLPMGAKGNCLEPEPSLALSSQWRNGLR